MDKIEKYMTKFKRSVETNPYTVITPTTELDELELFLQDNIFALGTSDSPHIESSNSTNKTRAVTDASRKFVLAVATSQDLEVRHIQSYHSSHPFSH